VGECDAQFRASHWPGETDMPSHIVVGLAVKDIAYEQNGGLIAVVLPPVGGVALLRPDIARLMHDRVGAVAGVFDDLALGDVDDRRTVAVAVPGHDTARFDRELAEAQLPVLDIRRLLLEVYGGEHRVGDALTGMRDRRARIGFELASGALAGR